MTKTILTIHNLSLELPHETLFEKLNISIKRGDRIGLVGRNGSGKSTLLSILARQIEPSNGFLETHYPSYYLPQIEPSFLESNESVESYVVRLGSSWPVVQKTLLQWFKTSAIQSTQWIKTLSGGEIVKLHISLAEAHHPELLLLDETTNHLDAAGLQVLKKFLASFSGAFIIVSHDPFFLDLVTDSIWELEGKNLTRYGGNYTFYSEQKRLAQEAKARDYKATQKELKKAKRSLQVEQKRAARSKKEGRKQAHDRSMSAMERGFFKNKASKTETRQRQKLEKIIQERTGRAAELKEKKRRVTRLMIKQDARGARRTLIHIENSTLKVGKRILATDVNLHIEYGDRIVLVGRNGSGKSLFAKTIVGQHGDVELVGKIQKSENLKTAYVDQKYQIIDHHLNLIENIKMYNANLTDEETRRQLARFLFYREEDVRKKAAVLSGGEAARLTLAMVTAGQIDLLILDEPTNNLDIETLDAIADALEDFQGALIVISHNIHFLERIRIETALVIHQQKLERMLSLPTDPKTFYNEIVSKEI
jgi:ATPase subunit of ABC transporter with duplicated ATPase domains